MIKKLAEAMDKITKSTKLKPGIRETKVQKYRRKASIEGQEKAILNMAIMIEETRWWQWMKRREIRGWIQEAQDRIDHWKNVK